MTLKRNGWLLKFARIGNMEAYKDSVSLCELFWDCMGSVFAITFVTYIVALVTTVLWYGLWYYLWPTLFILAIFASMVAGSLTLEAKMKLDDSIVRAAYDGIKNKFCPVMKIV